MYFFLLLLINASVTFFILFQEADLPSRLKIALLCRILRLTPEFIHGGYVDFLTVVT